MKRSSGFTLIEVMVALAIFAAVSAALIRSASLAVYQMRSLEDRMIATWVAENRMAELRIGNRDPARFRATGTVRDSIRTAGRSFEVRVDTATTDNQNMRRIEVSVYRDDGDDDTPLASLTGFLGRY